MFDYLARAQDLRQTGQPFVLATVVRVETPTSAKPGAKALITPDGVLTGWVGGSCTQPTVVRESLRALQTGQPRFLRLCPPDKMHGEQPGVIEVALTCISGGTLEIYLEPHLPPPQLLAIGHLPVVEALARLGRDMNYAVTVMGEAVTLDRFPGADRALPLDIPSLQFTPQTYVVVASHGNYDEPALEAALNSNAAYVALVASQKRREAVLAYLRGSGLAEERLARLKCPAGLDLGAVTPEEIALTIIAEIVQLRRRAPGIDPASLAAPLSTPTLFIDLVCGMTVDPATAHYRANWNGQTYYFCSPGCQRSFEQAPANYLASTDAARTD